MHQQDHMTPDSRRREPMSGEPAPARHTDRVLDDAGPVSRAVEHRLRPVPPPVALLAVIAIGYVGMVAVLVGVGEVLVHAGMLAGLRDWDDHVTAWMADHRTGILDTVTAFLSRAADTIGVVVCALVIELVLVVQRRWWPLLIVPVGLALELVTFLTVNTIVGRPRPDVVKLGSEPSTSSFPSGHTAATVVVWGGVAVLFCSPSVYRWVRTAAFAVVVVLTVAVGTARVYRGMHHPTDVMAGALMGIAALSVTVLAVRVTVLDARERHPERRDAAAGTPVHHDVPAVSA